MKTLQNGQLANGSSFAPGTAFGLLLAGAGCLWFVTQWDTPETGSAVLFTIGILGWGAIPAVAAHAAFAFPSGHLRTRVDRLRSPPDTSS